MICHGPMHVASTGVLMPVASMWVVRNHLSDQNDMLDTLSFLWACLIFRCCLATQMSLKLRARGPAGGAPCPLPDITPESTFADLDCALRIAFNIPETTPIVVLSGFPPRQLNLDDDTPLGTSVPANEILTVRKGEGEATVIQGTGAMKKGRGGGGKSGGGGNGASSSTPVKRKSPSASAGAMPGSNIRTLSGPLHRSTGGGGGGGRKRTKRVAVQSEDDIGTLLLSAVTGGGGRVGQCMRAAFRIAVEKQFDEAKANARISSARSGQYTITEMQEARRLFDGAASRMKVSFHKGLGARSNFEDEVDIISRVALVGAVGQVLSDANAREMLKPANMAGCSPRFFWSLVKLFGGDVEAGLRQLIPTQDWSFLTERARKLSEKAQANLEQEEELQREKEEAARLRREEREARKAQKEARVRERAEAQQAAAASRKQGPIEVLDDEEKGGGKEGTIEAEEEVQEEGDVQNLFPEEVDAWIDTLRGPALRLKNARELACQTAADLGPRLRALGGKAAAVSDEEVQGWIDASQLYEMEDIMYEVLEGEEAVYDALVAANMALPKAIVLWSAAPRAMIDTVREEIGNEEFENVKEVLTPENILAWAESAKGMIEKMPWLEDWAATGNVDES